MTSYREKGGSTLLLLLRAIILAVEALAKRWTRRKTRIRRRKPRRNPGGQH